MPAALVGVVGGPDVFLGEVFVRVRWRWFVVVFAPGVGPGDDWFEDVGRVAEDFEDGPSGGLCDSPGEVDIVGGGHVAGAGFVDAAGEVVAVVADCLQPELICVRGLGGFLDVVQGSFRLVETLGAGEVGGVAGLLAGVAGGCGFGALGAVPGAFDEVASVVVGVVVFGPVV